MYVMEKRELNGNHFLKVSDENARSKEDVGSNMTKSTSGLSHVSNCKQKDTIVTISSSDKGYYFTRLQVGIFIFVLLLTLSTVIVLVVCFTSSAGRFSNTSSREGSLCDCYEQDDLSKVKDKTEKVISYHTPQPHTSDSFEISDEPEIGIRLPGDVIPIHYDLDLDVYIDQSRYTGSVKILTKVTKETRLLIVHVKPYMLSIEEQKVDIYPVDTSELGPSNSGETPSNVVRLHYNIPIVRHFMDFDKEIHAMELKEPMVAGMHYIIHFRQFHGLLLEDLKGIYLSSYKDSNGNKRMLIASQLQSTDARKVFPCFDEPAMKATFSVSITHSSEYTALGNMPVKSERCLDSCSRKRVEFETTPVMSTYLLAFVVSDFEYSERSLNQNCTLRIWCQPDLVNQTYYALDFATKTYAYFTDYFEIPDVVPKADHVAVPDFSGGAMENWGLVIYRETALLYDPEVSSSSNKYMVTLIVAHEIAHTWFGNMVTMKWWDDLWLNEGFASTLMYFAMDHAYPQWNVLDIVVAEDMFPVMVKDALVTSHPVSPNINHPDEIAESYDQISYNKGMALLRMLESFLGKEGFRKGLQTYVRNYMFDNAEMSELWQTFTEATNSSLRIGEIMDTWTRQMGYPVISIKTDGNYFILEQSRFLINTKNGEEEIEDSIYGYKWYVPFTYMMEGDTDSKLHWLKMGPGKIKKTSDGWILGNVNYGGFYRVNYEVEMWQRLANQLATNHTVISLPNRAGLIGDAFNLARATMLDYGLALNLTTYLNNEEHYVPWKAFLDCLEFIRGMLTKQSAYVQLEKYISELVAPVLSKIGTDDKGTLPEMYLRRMLLKTGCDTGVKQAVQYAKDQFNDWMKNGTRLPTDFSQVIYAVGVREGSVDEWDYVWLKSQETNSPSEREMLLEALSFTQKPWLLWRYANWIFDVDKIKMQDVRLVMSYFSNTPLGRMIALHFLMNRWDDLNEKFGDDTFIIREMIGEVTQFVNTEFELRQLEVLFTEKPPKAARKGADSALALIRANIVWMKQNYNSIANWLDQHVESNF